MKITELIKELENYKEQYGDIDVQILADYDCGYAAAGGDIEEIEYTPNAGRWVYDPTASSRTKHDIFPAITLLNHEG